jgi:membrane protease YdiL (CAAX protease family)
LSGIFILGQNDLMTAREAALWAILSLIAIFIIWRTGAFRPTSVIGPERDGRVTTRPLAILMVAAFMLSLLVSQGFFTFRQLSLRDEGQKTFDLSSLTPRDWAFLAVVPGAAGIVLLLIGHLAGRGGAVTELGFARRQILPGVLRGVLGFVVVLPIMIWWMLILQWFYKIIQLQHPKEHELLHELSQARHLGTKAAIVIGATFVAPVFEELIFRAHLQTLLVRAFKNIVTQSQPVIAGEALPPIDPPSSKPHVVWPYWLAIFFSSLLFAAIHTGWMAPAIFVLSICLGYLYQRTGNLWATITLHSLFNVFNTIMFLVQR